jgi:hypothetical protein
MNTAKHAYSGRILGWIFIVTFVQCLVLVSSQYEYEKGEIGRYINWDEVKKALETYESHPDKESAGQLLAAIPDKPAVCQLGNREAAAFAILNSVPFEKAVVAGDKLIAESAFRLLEYMKGGAVNAELRIMLGRFLTREPATFLELLNKYSYQFSTSRDYPVDMTEILDIVPEVTSKEDWRRYKRENMRLYTERLKALESVKNPELIELRDACIQVIQAVMAGLEQRIE